MVLLMGFVCSVSASAGEAEQMFEDIQKAVDGGGMGFSAGIKSYRRLIKEYPDSDAAAAAYYNMGKLFEKLDRVREASAAYMTLIDNYAESEWVAPALGNLYRIGSYLYNQDERGFFGSNSCEEAKKIFRKILEKSSSIENAEEIQYRIGMCSMRLKDYEEATSDFQKIVDDFSAEPWVEKAEYQLGIALSEQSLPAQRDQTMTDRAIAQLNRFLDKYPDSQFSGDVKGKLSILRGRKAESLYYVCLFYRKQREEKAFLFYSEKLIRHYPNTEWANLVKTLIETS